MAVTRAEKIACAEIRIQTTQHISRLVRPLGVRLFFWWEQVKPKSSCCQIRQNVLGAYNLLVPVEVAVIDEIQMLRDNGRGWAWTRALLGLMAEEIHVCGEEGAVELVSSLMCTTGEDVEVGQCLMYLFGGETISHSVSSFLQC